MVIIMNRRLTLEETKKCLIAWQKLKDQDALTLLVTCNNGLIIYFVKKFLGKGLTFEELQSVGKEGFIRACSKIDYHDMTLTNFSSYVSTAIINQIKRELNWYSKHSHVISFEEPIAFSKDGDEMKVEDLLGSDPEELIENVIAEIKSDILKEALQSLTSRERQIILLRYGLDDKHRMTQSEISKLFHCSKQTISIQEQKALRKMRHPKNTRKLKDFIEE